MKPEIYLTIPQPCHENWNEMTPTDKGKFCAACSKQVIDFTLMSDTQILQYLSNSKGNLCGRLSQEQLDRELIERKLNKKKSWWLAFTISLAALFQKSQAQTISSGDTHPLISNVENQRLTGLVAVSSHTSKEKTVSGFVVDETNKPLQSAIIMIPGTNRGVITDSLGSFSLSVPAAEDSVNLHISCLGYETIERTIATAEAQPIFIKMTEKTDFMGEVIVTSHLLPRMSARVGGVSICRKVTKREKIDSAIQKITNIQLFLASPNPVQKGNSVSLKIMKSGRYEIQFLSNTSQLIKAQTMDVNAKNYIFSFLVPANISAGLYYLRLIGHNKSSIQKIIVQ